MDRHVGEAGEAPVGLAALAGHHEVDGEPVALDELTGVLDDDADPARELEVVDDERDLHGKSSGAVVGVRPSLVSSSFM